MYKQRDEPLLPTRWRASEDGAIVYESRPFKREKRERDKGECI